MNNKNIMIVGAGGSLGRLLCDDLNKNDYKIVAVDINENSMAYLHRIYGIPEKQIYVEDVRDFYRLKNIIDYHKIDIVINCAALKHVMWCEYNIKHAIDINIISNLELINYLRKVKKKFVFISSDKAICPKNIYALTKQFTDYITRMYNFRIVRGVNFIKSKGSVLDIWREQKDNKKPFTVVKNEKCNRYFITILDMVNLVKESIENDSDKIEFVPKVIYKIYVADLFNAFLKINNLSYEKLDKEGRIKEIILPDIEKIAEDIDFKTKIIEIRNIEKIIKLI